MNGEGAPKGASTNSAAEQRFSRESIAQVGLFAWWQSQRIGRLELRVNDLAERVEQLEQRLDAHLATEGGVR